MTAQGTEQPTKNTEPQGHTQDIPENITERPATRPTPAQDLYRYVNGPWLANHEIPADRAVDGPFHTLRDQAEEEVHAIVQAAGPDTRMGALYSSFMDQDGDRGIEQAGLRVLEEDLAPIRAAGDITELAEVLGRLDVTGVGGVVGYFVEKDAKSSSVRLYLLQSGLGLPDEAYYRQEQHSQTREAYLVFTREMLELCEEGGQSLPGTYAGDPQRAAQAILDFETRLAKGHWDNVSSRDADKTYNPTAVEELPDGFPFARWLRATEVDPSVDSIIVSQPSYLQHVADLVRSGEVELDTWKLWALWRVLLSRAAALPRRLNRRHFDFYGRTLSGATEQRDRWKRGVGLVESQLGEEVGRAFVAEHFPPEHKAKMLQLVEYLTQAYRERISQLPWMTEATRDRALAKLEQFRAKIGYPDKWRDYSQLEFSPAGENLVANIRRGSAFNHRYAIAKLNKPADLDEWFATPQTVNAFYNPVNNDITFPAAILRPPFFDPEADVAGNFGGIGAVIGHEIGHGFDDQGSKFDGEGNLNSWWTDEDRAAFTALTDKLVKQYSGLVPTGLAQRGITEHSVNGEFTLGENIGDLGGLGISVVALQRYLADQGLDANSAPSAPVEGLEGEYTALQRLFLRWARVWQTAIRPQMSVQYVSIDPHSPAEFRCNVVASNVAEFYEAFEVTPDDAMWLDEADRVTIW
ncbi:M13 family metallopeptidase [Corynebacterium heidelbergense]|uniref:Peptidase M13 n=1 Tax=Corynebacterium heidelbergense TaxID=2055947 RepID=A0A364V5H7_9CORY|nr:M13-type metalloendopeptidase [Corynebacterium heidelbergense]RAV31893.1 peptidase M13 [Corynebacterium heidelbergense]